MSLTPLLYLLPVCVYAMSMSLAVFQEGNLSFGRLDLGVLVLVLGYVAAGVIAAGWRGGRYASRFLLVAYSTMLTLALSEVALRGIRPMVPPDVPWPPMHRVSIAGSAMPGIAGPIEFTVNSLGLRGPEVDLDEVALRILCVGGSTTESLFVTDELSWPWSLQNQLAQRLGKPVFVGNAGRSGHFTLHHEHLLRHYALEPKFDWVIILAGINDWGALLGRRTYEQRQRSIPDETFTFSRKGRAPYRSLALVQALDSAMRIHNGDTLVQDPEGDFYELARAQRRAALKRKTIRTLPPDLDDALATYAANLRRIISLTSARRQKLLLMTQPTMYRKDLPEHLERLLWAHSGNSAYSSEVLEQMLTAFNETMLTVCDREAVECLDLASRLPKDTSIFYDDVHFNISGSQKVASIVAQFLAVRLTADGPAQASAVARQVGGSR